ncbi:MAG: Hsp70 family protein [Ilumatobacteraceae bacterium]
MAELTGYVVGVDLGTTYSAAAVARGDVVEVCTLGTTAAQVPSMVVLREDGEIVTGEAAERRAAAEPTRTAREFKRRLGDPVPLIVGGTPYGAEALMAHLLRSIIDQVAEREGSPPSVVVLTHPANYSEYKKGLLREAVRLAGLDNETVLLVTEPEAAAIAYAGQQRVEVGDVVAVYDFGGGTFDAAVVRKTESGFELLGIPEGMERLGGIDIDQAVLAHVDASLGGLVSAADPSDPQVRVGQARLRDECRRAKEALSSDTDTSIPVSLPGIQTEVRLTRDELETMIRPRLGETMQALERATRSSGVEASAISRVLLVGGSSRIPAVAQLVREDTGLPVALDAHPKFAIAIGAAMLGATSAATEAAAVVAASSDAAVLPRPAPVPTGANVLAAGALGAGAGLAGATGVAAVLGGETAAATAGAGAALAGPAGVALGSPGPAGAALGSAGPAGIPLGSAGPNGVPLGPAGPGGVASSAGPAGAPLTPVGAVAKQARRRVAMIAGSAVGAAVAVVTVIVVTGGDDAATDGATTTIAAIAAAPIETSQSASPEITAGAGVDVTSPASTTAPDTVVPSTVGGVAGRGIQGLVELVAGNGSDDGSGRPGPVSEVSLGSQARFAVAPNGDVYTISGTPTVLRVHDGLVEEIYGGGPGEFAFGGIAIGPNGDAYVTMSTGVKRISADGSSELVVDAVAESLGSSFGPIAFDGVGNMYFYEATTYRVLRRGGDGTLSHVAGSGTQGSSGQPTIGDGGPAIAAPLSVPVALVIDGLGNLLIADAGQAVVRSVGSDGIITTVAGGGEEPMSASVGKFADDGTLAADLKLGQVGGVSVDGKGRLYVSDGLNRTIFRFAPGAGIELLIADQAESVESLGLPANQTRIRSVTGIAVDAQGNLLFVDTNRVLRIVGAVS